METLLVGRKLFRNSPSDTDDPGGADRRTVGNLVTEARKFSGLAVDTLVELTKDSYSGSTRYNAATALLDRGYGRPAQSLDLHLSADAITKRLSDMTDAELAALEQRMIAAAPIVLEATAEVSDDAGELADGDTDAERDGDGCADDECMDDEAMAGVDGTGEVEIPRRMPLPNSALTQNSSAASLGVRQPATIRRATDLPRVKRGPCDNPAHLLPEIWQLLPKCHEWLAPEVLEARQR